MSLAEPAHGEPVEISKSRRAHAWIRERITSGAYGPGYRLVLTSLAAELSMSVVPVREAIRELTAEGLVTFERNVGARVTMVDPAQYQHAMQAISVVESAATALSAAHLTAEDLRRAHEINDLMRERVDHLDARLFSSLNQEFHHILYSRCPNPRLLEIVEGEWARLGHLRDSVSTFVPGRAPESVAEHDAMLGLIEGGASADEIEQAVRRHRTGSLSAFLTTHDAPPARPEGALHVAP
ncbi:GntR family transcriptional regulator [Nocardioides sp. Kera G14]|uniref:GntR family transcriptional regulator n=1 Tax=Nocardioides sp. Kera G14 TaxID=2884264 RepID=UPI001D123B3F|nr:GntR family transcriptional regulator [Nocardioides sp. Kera G14]UDY23456.1 GntR family transcriptional regulator [Nocardioides sp. Kera G14]